MPRWNLAWLLGIASIALLGLAVSHSAPQRGRDRDYELVRLLVDVLDEVDHKYVRPLDDDAKQGVESLIKSIIRDARLTCVIVTHDISQAARRADRVMMMQAGRAIRIGPVKEVLHAQQVL